jgi:hypothetical protein
MYVGFRIDVKIYTYSNPYNIANTVRIECHSRFILPCNTPSNSVLASISLVSVVIICSFRVRVGVRTKSPSGSSQRRVD